MAMKQAQRFWRQFHRGTFELPARGMHEPTRERFQPHQAVPPPWGGQYPPLIYIIDEEYW